jgi:hypothetical protein
MTALPIQKNLDGSVPTLKLKDIFTIEPKVKTIFAQCVELGLSKPLDDNTMAFQKTIKPRLAKLVGWDAEKDVLSASETYDTVHQACLEAINCWMFYRRFKNPKQAWAAFKSKFGRPPLFKGVSPFEGGR